MPSHPDRVRRNYTAPTSSTLWRTGVDEGTGDFVVLLRIPLALSQQSWKRAEREEALRRLRYRVARELEQGLLR